MAFPPALAKGLLGFAAVSSPVALGGLYLYKQKNTPSLEEEINNAAFSSDSGWSITATNLESSKITDGKLVEIVAKWSNKKTKDQERTWICKIQGKITGHVANNSLDIETQKTTLAREIGIDGENRTTNKNYNFKKFFESCKNNMFKTITKTQVESILNLGDINANNNKYKFSDSNFKNLYEGTNEILKKLGLEGKTLNSSEGQEVPTTIKFADQTSFTVPSGLKIKIEETNDTNFPEGLKFTLVSESEINSIEVKANTNTEFKIKIDGDNYSLEKTWDIEKWASKVNLDCVKTTKTCTLKSGKKINVWKNESDYITEASFMDNIKFEENKENHSQGFKFFVETNDITLSEGTKKKTDSGISKLTHSNTSYEIGMKIDNEIQKPFLIEKTTNG